MNGSNRTEKDKMLAGEMYLANDPQLVAERLLARARCQALNTLPASASDDARRAATDAIFGAPGNTYVTAPFFCDYGTNITLGANVYFNFNCVVLDVAPVTIGDNVMFGPAVQVYTATHPLDAVERRSGREFAKPIAIGDDVWIGGGAILCPGVTIGPRSVIGAGSVVTRDLPADVFAAGNPCRVIRSL
ncbi:sugar O-acetyltransferase [Noviluteimonas gilva]|uniref:Sugar O-acetyltransferase n=1 Tax=Noviluteimonas gilva TaxID=2682097 RepID=A0A7C9LHI2_9GAMM|nr:sugar O-acetyltransferase [Lysobacter gilvus]MUV14921.1 sugar O-acetyltransferase [Lysobacter gilvus]